MMILLLISCEEPMPIEESRLSPTEIGLGIEAASLGLLSVDPTLMHEAWTSSMQNLSDPACPPMEEHNGMDLWRESCTTQEGHQFWGWALNFRGHEVPTDCCIFEDFDWLSGQAQIIRSDGTMLQNFGDILHQEGRNHGGDRVLQGFTYGDFYWDSNNAEGSWLL